MTLDAPTLPFLEPVPLMRGGAVLATSGGLLQFGAPPETLKDTIGTQHGVPQVFVLMSRFFDVERGITFAEIEFPIYFNFFMKGQRLRLICTDEQRHRVERIMQESLFGPRQIDLRTELPGRPEECPWKPDLRAEMEWFRQNRNDPEKRPMNLHDLVEFVPFDESGVADLGKVVVRESEDGGFHVLDRPSGRQAVVPGNLALPSRVAATVNRETPFDPPVFGVTILGSGHGFDPSARTTGFILWLNGCGVLVDPPVDTSHWLSDHDISPRSVESVLLTHCHGDHDAGTLQQALFADRLRLYTTPTIFESFLRKSSAITGLPPDRFHRIIDFVPVAIRSPILIHGARFSFDYRLHSIPTIGFQVWLGGSSLVYSADHLNDPDAIARMRASGAVSEGRAKDLLSFPWDHDLVLHEAGVPPIHTSIDALRRVPDAVKKRMYLVHTTANAIPADSGLRLAPLGLDATLRLDAEAIPAADVIRRLRALRAIDPFGLALDKAIEFLEVSKIVRFRAGDTVLRRGDLGLFFYVILSGKCAILGGEVPRKIFGMYETFGEVSLLYGIPRTADVVALTDAELVVLEKDAFLQFVSGTALEQNLHRLRMSRAAGTWALLDRHPVLAGMNPAQRSRFQSLLGERNVDANSVLCEPGDVPISALIAEGELVETRNGREKRLGPGNFVVEVEAVTDGAPALSSIVACSPTKIHPIEAAELREFLLQCPGVYLRLLAQQQGLGGSRGWR